jgi:hypothetical protein
MAILSMTDKMCDTFYNEVRFFCDNSSHSETDNIEYIKKMIVRYTFNEYDLDTFIDYYSAKDKYVKLISIAFNKLKYPKYLVRPDDFNIFSLNPDGKKYSIDRSKREYPDQYHNEYKIDVLESYGFYPIEESQFEEYNLKYENHYNELKKNYKYPHHGDEDDD